MYGAVHAASTVLALAMVAAPPPAGHTATAGDYPELRAVMQRLTAQSGAPGALAVVNDRHGQTVITSGVGDLRTGAPVPRRSRFRIGSVTKTFVATVVLQLAGEHKVILDVPVERYLPDLIRGNGNDGREISVRQLLQHTSGLPDYLTYLTPQAVISHPLEHRDPSRLVGIALEHPRLFPPGERFGYSNINYMVAGLIIEKVTGHPYGQEIQRRISRPLGLYDTYVPGDETGIPGPHPNGYIRTGPDEEPTEFTRFNPSAAWASGEMISSGRDLNRFFAALIDGHLLSTAELREMMLLRPTGRSSGQEYGLGLERTPLPCGGAFWGHDGDSLGFSARVGIITGGRQITVMANLNPGGSPTQDDDLNAAVTGPLPGPLRNQRHDLGGPGSSRPRGQDRPPPTKADQHGVNRARALDV
jgi:D-alanyl-D-alanine carboxypeptidase